MLKGPAAVTSDGGQAAGLGGVINIVSKTPLDHFVQAYGVTVDTHGYVSPSVNVSGPLNASKTALFRLTGQLIRRETFIDNIEEHSAGMPTLLLRSPDDRDTLLLRLSYTLREGDRYYGVLAYGTGIDTAWSSHPTAPTATSPWPSRR